MTSLEGTAECLEADVVCSAVAGEGQEAYVILDLAPTSQCAVGGLGAGAGGRSVPEGCVYPRHVPCREGEDRGGDLETTRGVCNDYRLLCGHQHLSGDDGLGATGTQTVAGGQPHLPLGELLERQGHSLTPRKLTFLHLPSIMFM